MSAPYEPLPFSPAVMEWARTSAGLSIEDVASRLGLGPGYVAGLESGESDVNWSQLRKLAEIYRRPISVLLRKETPKQDEFPTDFRTVGGAPVRRTRAVLAALRRATRIQEALSSLPARYLPTANVPEAQISENPESLAYRLRERLGVDPRTSLSWASANVAFNNWRGMAQGEGVLVLVARMPRDDCRGFALWRPPLLPAVVITNDEGDEARSFTLWHEFGHLMLRASAACLELHGGTGPLAAGEAWCNRFAATVLAPEESILLAASDSGISAPTSWGLNEIAAVARRLKVSRHVIALKLEDLGFKEPGFYRAILPMLMQDGGRPARADEREIKLPAYRRAASELGFLPVLPILRAVRDGETGAADAASVLRIPAGRLGVLGEEAERLQSNYARPK